MGIDLPTLGIIVVSAAIDAINPCAIGVLILMISMLISGKNSIGRFLWMGGLYIFGIFLTYLIAGLGFTYFFSSIPLWVTESITIAVALLVVVAGILEIKDYFWYGKGISLHIPVVFAEKIKVWSKSVGPVGIFFLGAFVAAVELPCTGAPYLAVITMLSLNFNWYAFLLLVIYNFIFVLPLIVILLMVVAGVRVEKVHSWKAKNKHYMRLAIGFLLVALGWLLILLANGTIHFG